jgi:hypothetical protein
VTKVSTALCFTDVIALNFTKEDTALGLKLENISIAETKLPISTTKLNKIG